MRIESGGAGRLQFLIAMQVNETSCIKPTSHMVNIMQCTAYAEAVDQ
jgi:hypothetical protein